MKKFFRKLLWKYRNYWNLKRELVEIVYPGSYGGKPIPSFGTKVFLKKPEGLVAVDCKKITIYFDCRDCIQAKIECVNPKKTIRALVTEIR